MRKKSAGPALKFFHFNQVALINAVQTGMQMLQSNTRKVVTTKDQPLIVVKVRAAIQQSGFGGDVAVVDDNIIGDRDSCG